MRIAAQRLDVGHGTFAMATLSTGWQAANPRCAGCPLCFLPVIVLDKQALSTLYF
jgi:hypothetical protein